MVAGAGHHPARPGDEAGQIVILGGGLIGAAVEHDHRQRRRRGGYHRAGHRAGGGGDQAESDSPRCATRDRTPSAKISRP